ncbi:SH3 domain-binding protein 5-like [Xenia sp. Carnegie-2017]|uniref:SH3 domain-binding protein 5-like n=1 Tax=Xenia sp. Carnegie-2017 TaxID=2897299 RepID=UPI001F0472F5|nr:SH3 domain-binding protein 5-like [Xenia sp. Carnegie-2017]
MDDKCDLTCSNEESEGLDPRIQEQLDRLNGFCTSVNHLEMESNEAQRLHQQVLSSANEQLQQKRKELGKCVDRALPFYVAKSDARQAFKQLQKTASDYERANERYNSAKIRVADLEKIMTSEGRVFDAALQELLNHATQEVMEAAELKRESSCSHHQATTNFQTLQKKVKEMNKNLRGAILKSRGYFELKAASNRQLELHKQRVFSLNKDLRMAKEEYAVALQSLEKISDEIHRLRKKNNFNKDLTLLLRENGVGAESMNPILEEESRYHNDLILGETVELEPKSNFDFSYIFTDDEEEFDSESEDTLSKDFFSRGERPSVSGSEGNSKDETSFSDIDLT